VYYVFGVISPTTTDAVYTLEVKQTDGVLVKAEIIEYKPQRGTTFNYQHFTGSVTSYTLKGDPINSLDYNDGEGDCPPSGGPEPGYNGSDNPNPGGGMPYYGGSSSGTDPIYDISGCWDILLDPEKPWLTLGYYNNCSGQLILLNSKNNASDLSPQCYDGSGVVITSGTSNETPCEKTKNIVNNSNLKSKIDTLKKFSLTAVEDEMGFHQDKFGNVTPASVNGNHHVDFTINQNSLGGIHNHTLNGAQIFSPRDILTLLDFAGVQNQTLPTGSTADNTGNAFLGMISQSGSYFITFNGGSGDLPPPMTQAEEVALEIKLNDAYRRITTDLLKSEGKQKGDDLSQTGLQKLFFAIVKEMELEGKINLIKQNSSNTSTIEQNSDGTIKAPIPC